MILPLGLPMHSDMQFWCTLFASVVGRTLLNSGAHAEANPELEIENNDVQSSHSATVGQINPEKLFYLMARGIVEPQARRLLIEGFLESALPRIENREHREHVAQMIRAMDLS